MDIRAKQLMNRIADEFSEILGNNLAGIYIHGSLAFGCFRWENSDMDFIAVTKTEPDFRQKKQIIKLMLDIDKSAPQKGIEMSLVLEKDCRNFAYPTPYQLHYSAGHKEKYIKNIDGHIALMQGTDKDLAAHFTVINHVGIAFAGKSISQVFSPVPAEYYMDSIWYDIENAVEEIEDNPVYTVLNLCRVLAFVKEKAVISKAQGGIWGMENLPRFSDVIQPTCSSYTAGGDFDTDSNRLKEFAEFMINTIEKHKKAAAD